MTTECVESQMVAIAHNGVRSMYGVFQVALERGKLEFKHSFPENLDPRVVDMIMTTFKKH